MALTSVHQQVWLGLLFVSTLCSVPVVGKSTQSTASLTTFTTFPTESIGRLTASTVTTETHTVVTSDGKTTTIPILPDHAHGCYFCPTDVGGLVLTGFTKPGVYPSHSPSGFPSAFPEITINSKGDPHFSSATKTSKLSSASSSEKSTSSESKTIGTNEVLTTLTAPETATLTETLSKQTTVSGKSSKIPLETTVTTTYSKGQVITKSTRTGGASASSSTSKSSSRSSGSSSGHLTTSASSSDKSRTSKLSTSKSGTSTSGSSGAVLTTFSSLPTDNIGTASSTITKPGKTTTTDKSGHTTILPVLPKRGSDKGLCWFCPPSGGGFILTGFFKVGVYPPGNLPGFPTIAPKITIGPDLIPTFSGSPSASQDPTSSAKKTSSSDTTTSSECTKATASSCKIVTSFSVDSNGKTTATATATSCVTSTGCSARDSTSATAVTTSASGCWKYTPTSVAASDEDDFDSKRRKRALEKRAGSAKPFSAIGTCTFPSKKKVNVPAYPTAAGFETWANPEKWYVPTSTALNNHACPVLTMTKYPTIPSLTAQAINGGTYGVGDDAAATQKINVDHVYEIGLLRGFMSDMVSGGTFNCDDFSEFWLTVDSKSGLTRLQLLYNQLPNKVDKIGFAGMDAGINYIKGEMFNRQLGSLTSPHASEYNTRIQYANQMALAARFVNSNDIAPLFRQINQRIFNALLGIDDLIAGCNADAVVVTPQGGKWASAYSTWMTDRISDQNKLITSRLSDLIATYSNDSPILTNGLDAFNAEYPEAGWGFDAGAMLDWTGNPMVIMKRDGGTCSKSAPASSATSVSATTTHTSSATASSKKATASSTSKPASSTTQTTLKTSISSTKTQSSSATPTADFPYPTATPSCFGASDGKFNQQDAQANIADFCSSSNLITEGATGLTNGNVLLDTAHTVAHKLYTLSDGTKVWFSITLWPGGTANQVTTAMCTAKFRSIITGCTPGGGDIGDVQGDGSVLYQVAND